MNEASEANLNVDKRILKCTPFLHKVNRAREGAGRAPAMQARKFQLDFYSAMDQKIFGKFHVEFYSPRGNPPVQFKMETRTENSLPFIEVQSTQTTEMHVHCK